MTFEVVSARTTVSQSSSLVVAVFRTGPVVAKFFRELADILDRVATSADELYLVGDVNIHFETQYDNTAADFIEYGLTHWLTGNCVVTQTHAAGGIIDVVCCIKSPFVNTDLSTGMMMSVISPKRKLQCPERDARCDGGLLGGSSATSVLWHDAPRQYVKLLHRKKSANRTGHIEDNRSNPRRLRQTFDNLLGRQLTQTSDVAADVLHTQFDEKVEGVRAATNGVDSPSFLPFTAICGLRLFTPLTFDDVAKAISCLPDKQCHSDPCFQASRTYGLPSF